jgi:hypothetical protein
MFDVKISYGCLQVLDMLQGIQENLYGYPSRETTRRQRRDGRRLIVVRRVLEYVLAADSLIDI